MLRDTQYNVGDLICRYNRGVHAITIRPMPSAIERGAYQLVASTRTAKKEFYCAYHVVRCAHDDNDTVVASFDTQAEALAELFRLCPELEALARN